MKKSLIVMLLALSSFNAAFASSQMNSAFLQSDSLSSAFKGCMAESVSAWTTGTTWKFNGDGLFKPKKLKSGKVVCDVRDYSSSLYGSAGMETESQFRKISIDGTSQTQLGFSCTDSARSLFNEIYRFTSPSRMNWTIGNVETRRLGDIACHRQLTDKNGNAVEDHYWCILTIDVYQNFIQALNL